LEITSRTDFFNKEKREIAGGEGHEDVAPTIYPKKGGSGIRIRNRLVKMTKR